MSRKTRKRGRRRLLVIVVLLALIVFGVFARGLLTSGKTTTERAQRELDTYAENNDVSLADYPDALVQLYARNPDARDFVRDYPKKKNLTPTIDLSGLAGSETVPLLLQWDERWGYREYNESIIGLASASPAADRRACPWSRSTSPATRRKTRSGCASLPSSTSSMCPAAAASGRLSPRAGGCSAST